MPGFEEEAFARAQQMHHARQKSHTPEHRPENGHTEPSEPKQEPKSEPPKPEKPSEGILELFFRDKERSIIMTLLLLLMDEKTDPGLLLALVYLLG